MAYYTQHIDEGLKFDTIEAAIDFFKLSLVEETPLGELYDTLHNEDWGDYYIQATGIDEKEVFITLYKSDAGFSSQNIKFSSYGSDEEIQKEELIKLLKTFIKTNDIVLSVLTEEYGIIKSKLEENHPDYIPSILKDLDKVFFEVSLENDYTSGALVTVSIIDESTNNKLTGSIQVSEEGRVEIEEVKTRVKSMFLKSIEGKLEGDTLELDGYNLDFLLDYARFEDKKLRVEIID